MVIAAVVQLVLSLIGAGIGLSPIDPLRYNGSPDALSFGIRTARWRAITSIVALYAGGWVAGHLARSPERTDGVLHNKTGRDALVNVVMAQVNVRRPEAEPRVEGRIKSYEKARATFEQKKARAEAKAKEVADSAVRASSQAALGTAVAFTLGAIVAALDGMSARRRDVLVGDTRRLSQ